MDFRGNSSPFQMNGGILESSDAEFLVPNREGRIMGFNPHLITTDQMNANAVMTNSSSFAARFSNSFSVPQQQQQEAFHGRVREFNWHQNQVTVLSPRNHHDSAQMQMQAALDSRTSNDLALRSMLQQMLSAGDGFNGAGSSSRQYQGNFEQSVAQKQMICPPKQEPEPLVQLSVGGVACANRLTQYWHHQRNRPKHNNITFWRKFVVQFFDLRVKKRLCLAMYKAAEGHAHFAFSRGGNSWTCNICRIQPGKGFEASYEVLARWLQLNFENGVIDEVQSLDPPLETVLPSGHTVLHYRKVVKQTMYKNTRIVREEELRVTFTPDLKIIRWESCARAHEEFVVQRAIAPQMRQLMQVSKRCEENLTRNISEGNLRQSLQASHNKIVRNEEQLARTLDTQVNDLGLTKPISRFLQITEVVHSMKDIMEVSDDTNLGPIESFRRLAGAMMSNLNQHQQNAQGFFPTGNSQTRNAEAERAWNALNSYQNVQPAGNSFGNRYGDVQASSSSGIRSGNYFPQPQAHEDPRKYVMNNGARQQPRPSQTVLTGSRYGPYGPAVGQRGPRKALKSASSQARRSTVNNNSRNINSPINNDIARLAALFRGNETIDVDALPDSDVAPMFPGVKIKEEKSDK